MGMHPEYAQDYAQDTYMKCTNEYQYDIKCAKERAKFQIMLKREHFPVIYASQPPTLVLDILETTLIFIRLYKNAVNPSCMQTIHLCLR